MYMRLAIPTRRQLNTNVPRMSQNRATLPLKRSRPMSSRSRCSRFGSGGRYAFSFSGASSGCPVGTGTGSISVSCPISNDVNPSTPNSSWIKNRVSSSLAFSGPLISWNSRGSGSPSVRCFPMPMMGASLMPWMYSGTRSGCRTLSAASVLSLPVIALLPAPISATQ
jgi:hypothetical protein